LDKICPTGTYDPLNLQSGRNAAAPRSNTLDWNAGILRAASQQRIAHRDQYRRMSAGTQALQEQ
jgi:hypothetical protein